MYGCALNSKLDEIFYSNICLLYDVLISHPIGSNRTADAGGALALRTVVFPLPYHCEETRDSLATKSYEE